MAREVYGDISLAIGRSGTLLAPPSVPYQPCFPWAWGRVTNEPREWGSTMRVPDSCELETTADLQIPGEITPYRLMPTALFFSFFLSLFAHPWRSKSLYVTWDDYNCLLSSSPRPWVDSGLTCGNILASVRRYRLRYGPGWRYQTGRRAGCAGSRCSKHTPVRPHSSRAWTVPAIYTALSGGVLWLTTTGHTSLKQRAMNRMPPLEKRSGCHGPFIIDAGGAETAWPLLRRRPAF